jgi:N-acetylglucosaminyldiphosphoundecaprenol N-acetyl-beta-D-mannosaminyltransferase
MNEARPDIIWVGLGAPKQERWMADHRERLNATILIGVGAAFDFHTGRLDRAPLWMQRSGLEWSYRLYKEPKRLWRRYLLGIPRFVVGVLRHPPRPL